MKRLHILAVTATLLLGGCDADNLIEDTGTTAQEFTTDTPITTKIVGGTAVAEGAYPWMTALHTNYNKGNGYNQLCGASLVGERWVLTAAHCLVSDEDASVTKASVLYVSVGTTNLNSNNIDYIGVKKVIVHPDYVSNVWPTTADLALLELDSAPGNETISIPRWKSTPVAGEKVSVAGWGRLALENYSTVNTLREVDLTVRSTDLCHPWYEFDRHLAGEELGNLDFGEMFCAGGTQEEVASACFGDSGGPVFVTRQDGQIVQAGIVKGGWDCGEGGVPGLYTKVAKYQSWINAQMTPTMYTGGSEEVLVAVEVQAEWVRLDANDSVAINMVHGDVGRYRLPETKTVTLTSNTGDVDLLVYNNWRMDPEDIVCTSDNGYDPDDDEDSEVSDKIDSCQLDTRGTYYARVISWETTNATLTIK